MKPIKLMKASLIFRSNPNKGNRHKIKYAMSMNSWYI